MIKKILDSPNRALITLCSALVLAIVHQYLFFDKGVGVSYPLFVVLFYGYMFVFARDRVRAFAWVDLFIASVVLLLSLTFALFDNELFHALNFLTIPGLIILHMAYLIGRKQTQWWQISLIGLAVDHLLPQSVRHWPTIGRTLMKKGGRKLASKQKVVVTKVFIGLIVSLPILIVVVGLLTSADGIFDQYLSGIPAWLNDLTLTPGLPRVIWIIIASVFFFSYVWGFVQPMEYESERRENTHWKNQSVALPLAHRDENDGENSDPVMVNPSYEGTIPNSNLSKPQLVEPLRLDPIIIGTVLFVINSVYLLFVFVQFSYLFGAGMGNLPSELSYAEYARSGFIELVLVTGINFFILVIALQFTRSGGTISNIVHQVLLTLLIVCSAVMLYSAFMRLSLYEEAYGYTYIRFLVHAFMIFLALLLLIAGLRIRYTTIPLIRCYIVLALTAYVAMNYVGMDNQIAERNIERYHQSGQIDANYLANLSADAVPQLKQFADESYPELHELLLLNQSQYLLEKNDRSWSSFNLSRTIASRELAELRKQ